MNQNSSRTLIAMVLSMAVIFVYYTFINPPPKVDPNAKKPEVAQQNKGPETVSNPATPSVNPSPDAPPPVAQKSVSVETEKIKATYSSHPGAFVSWVLKGFHEKVDKTTPSIDLLQGGEALSLTIGDKVINDVEITEESNSGAEWLKTLKAQSVSGYPNLEVLKTTYVTKTDQPYVVEVDIILTNRGTDPLTFEPRLWLKRPQKPNPKTPGFFSFLTPPPDVVSPLIFVDTKLKAEKNWDKLKPQNEITGIIHWTGLEDRYFLSAIVAQGAVAHGTGTEVSAKYGREGNIAYTSLSYGRVTLPAGGTVTQKFRAYLGPKDRDELVKAGSYVEQGVDYGWFGFVAVPLLYLMIFLYKFVGNWGVAIILLTFIVKLLLHPVNKKAMMSMKEMQKIQPELQKLREKFKGDQQRLNQEMMGLFKTHKVNPMGGCLPMLLQMPIYIALYRVLNNSIQLYHAPFFGFYQDLSAPDPYLITPVILGIMMVLQQKLTPTASMDPAQQKMMMLMPLMFIVFMVFLPVGLVIYILVNTVMSVIQQYMIHKDVSGMDLVKKLIRRRA